VPYQWYTEHGVRRYGFHGTSFLYTAKRAAALLKKNPKDTNLIICHIGNGASMCAVKDGCSYDTTMGLTPLEGLVMGTRSGDIDPAIINFVCRKAGVTSQEVENMLNKKSGILGLTTQFIDRRDVVQAAQNGDTLCQLALDIEGYRIKKYIGAYSAALGRVDAVVFTAGVGEMGPEIRERALSDLNNLGIILDHRKNKISRTRNAETRISAEHSPVPIFVIPTDEELVMTEDTYALMQGTYRVHTEFTYSFEDCNYVNLEREDALKKDLIKNPDLNEVIIRSCND
jgi:acetate kinase